MRPGPVDGGYVGELFPLVVEANHGSKDDQVRKRGCRDEGGWGFCREWREDCPLEYGPGCRLRMKGLEWMGV